MLFSENYPECGMGPLHHEWRHLRGIANTMWSYVYPLLNEQVEKFCYCPSHNIPLGGGESQIQVADPRGQLDYSVLLAHTSPSSVSIVKSANIYGLDQGGDQ